MNYERGLAGGSLLIMIGLGLAVIIGGSYMLFESVPGAPQTQSTENTDVEGEEDMAVAATDDPGYTNSGGGYSSGFANARDYFSSKISSGSINLQSLLEANSVLGGKAKVSGSATANSKNLSNIQKIQNALNAYHQDHGSYPAQLSDLVPAYLSSVPQNPTAPTGYTYTQIQDGLSYQLDVPSSSGGTSGGGQGGGGTGGGTGGSTGGGGSQTVYNEDYITAHQVPYCLVERC